MADVETKETTVVSTPEKKVVEDEKEVKKDTPVKEANNKAAEEEEVDEDSKASENGNGNGTHKEEESKENGHSEEKETDEKEVENTNGNSEATNDVCSIKRKSTGGGDVTDDAAKDVVSPKKAKLDEKPAAVEAESNGS